METKTTYKTEQHIIIYKDVDGNAELKADIKTKQCGQVLIR
jgi:hypothetical protein